MTSSTRFVMDDVVAATFDTCYTGGDTLWLFKGANGKPCMRLYSAKIWQEGVLIRSFVPVKDNITNEYGLLDTINAKFYANAGTGKFIAGGEV